MPAATQPPPEYVPDELEDPSGDESDEQSPHVCAFMFYPAKGATPAPDVPGKQFGTVRFFHIDETEGFDAAEHVPRMAAGERLALARRLVPGTWWPLAAAPGGVSNEDAVAQWKAVSKLARYRNRVAQRDVAKANALVKDRREQMESEARRNIEQDPVLEDYIAARMGRAQALAALARSTTALRNADENREKLWLLLRRLEDRFPGTLDSARRAAGVGACRAVEGDAVADGLAGELRLAKLAAEAARAPRTDDDGGCDPADPCGSDDCCCCRESDDDEAERQAEEPGAEQDAVDAATGAPPRTDGGYGGDLAYLCGAHCCGGDA